ncbi:MAG: hypothetical protein Rhims3KO_34460 [Hyphomicrobiales bacterium]
MTRITTFLAAAAVLSMPLTSLADEPNEGLRLAQLSFASMDGSDRGYVDMSEYLRYGVDVFVSMDQDESGGIDLPEFMDWDFGMSFVAEDRDAVPAYETALRVVFGFWDRNGDGMITSAEHGQSLVLDYQRADTDRDGKLTEEEYLSGFSVMVALRAALNPEPLN